MIVMPCIACESLSPSSCSLSLITSSLPLYLRWSFFVEVCQQNALRLQEPSRDFDEFDYPEPSQAALNRFTHGKRLQTFISLACCSSNQRSPNDPSDEVSIEEDVESLDEFEVSHSRHDEQSTLSINAMPYSAQYQSSSRLSSTPSPHSPSSPQRFDYSYDSYPPRISPISVVHLSSAVLTSPIRFAPKNPRIFS
jgi:hypothetical protein